jgi:hypothetical protein
VYEPNSQNKFDGQKGGKVIENSNEIAFLNIFTAASMGHKEARTFMYIFLEN